MITLYFYKKENKSQSKLCVPHFPQLTTGSSLFPSLWKLGTLIMHLAFSPSQFLTEMGLGKVIQGAIQ